MFGAISTEVSDRMAQASQLVRAIAGAEAGGEKGVMQNTRAAKGLVFVLLYAAYEYCVTQSFQAALRALNAHLIPHRDLRSAVLALALDDECKSLSDRKLERAWSNRTALFEKSRNTSPVAIKDTLFPSDGSHMREGQLDTLRRLLGIPVSLVPDRRFLGRIQEFVEHRNAVAHGRERADTIGKRFTVADLEERVRDANVLFQHIIATIESHCADPANFR